MKKGWTISLAVLLLTGALAGCASKNEASGTDAQGNGKPKELVVSTWGFSEDLLKKNVFEPFEKANNVKIKLEVGNNSDRLNKVRMKAHQVDVIMLAEQFAAQGIEEGLFEKIDRSHIPNIDNLFDVAKAPNGTDYGPAYTVGSSGIIYDKTATSQPVTSYADLWRPEFKGKLSLPDITTTDGAFLVDFASKVGGAQAMDTEKAFGQLKTLGPSVVKFYTKSSDLANMFNQKEVAVATVQNFVLATIKKANPNVEWVTPKEGSYAVRNTMNLVKGTKNKELGEKFIDWWLSEEVQKANALDKVDSPANKNVKLTPQEAEGLTYGADTINNLKTLDWNAVNKNMKTWIDRWNRDVVSN
ncbi:spermidine/putrescine ABC transporter substrate-binding protein [Paenibacillus sp. J31TS4]|uniref:ABC transporter substrate-binding protein n=1 Tax=Paenibacillus sp. J31TS4 TaxID=2807195 RepID=UPI001B257EE2|nr:ABC transporter substrate-binding protein [Paenibacillus sp. J31TS4]GIP40218.1 spermidine/putrescine ABC transporter substrate-binding protein [Paenibacillus sp. J31TS4]